MDGLRQDLRFALRMLRKTPSVTAVAVLTLAVAIGATTSIFSAVSAMLLRPLPFPDPAQLIALQDIEPQTTPHGFSWPEFTDLRSQAPDLAGLSVYRQETANLTDKRLTKMIKDPIATNSDQALDLLLRE